MKKRFFLMLLMSVLFSCATTGSGGKGVSLQEAIEQSAEKIAADLPQGTRVAIINFDSTNDNLSYYIMEELTGALFDRKIEVADRRNLEYVYRELKLQMSGDVSDESAKSIGKFLGAEAIIVGQMIDTGRSYRYQTSAIFVEEATRGSVTRLDVINDQAMRSLISSLANQVIARGSRYGVDEQASPETVGQFLDRGMLFIERGEWEIAIMDFTEALKLNSNLVAAYINRGLAYSVKMDSDSAIADFDHAIRLDPNNIDAYYFRSVAYFDKGDKDRAIADSNQVIRLQPNKADGYINRGFKYFQMGEYDLALADYDRAVRFDPNSPYGYEMRGGIYLERQDYDRAIADFEAAVRLGQNDVRMELELAYSNRGYAYYTDGDYNRAIADYEAAVRLNPNDESNVRSLALAYNGRGNAYYTSGDYNRAIADYEAAVRLNPNDDVIRKNLENARQARGR